jgi:hypothetical protein
MVPPRIRHPLLFLPRPSTKATSSATLGKGPGPASLLERYGKRKRSIYAGVPFGKGTGAILVGPVGPRMERGNAAASVP